MLQKMPLQLQPEVAVNFKQTFLIWKILDDAELPQVEEDQYVATFPPEFNASCSMV